MTPEERWRRDPEAGPVDKGRELDEEILFHLEELTRRLRAEGLEPEAARAEALRRFGAVGPIRAVTARIDRHQVQRRSRLDGLRDGWRDVRFAVRQLRRNPAFTVLAASVIGLGVGITGTVLSTAYSLLVRPLPYHRAEELFVVYGHWVSRGERRTNISHPDYVAWRDRNGTLSGLGIWDWRSLSLTDGTGDAERVATAEVSPEVFPILGARPVLGRTIAPDDTVPGAAPVIVLGHSLWKRRYGGDSTLIGRPIRVNDRPVTVIGVMPPRFAFPDGEVAWTPFVAGVDDRDHGNRFRAGALGRTRPGITLEAATVDLDRISAGLERESPNSNRDWRPDVLSLRDDLVGGLRRPLAVFIAAVACLILIVSANVANLLLARGLERRREMAVRTAMGAGRARLVRQLVIESLALAGLGAVLGVAVAGAGIRLVAAMFPDGVPIGLRLELDPAAIGITLAVTVATGVLAGLLPALRTARFDLVGSLRDGGERSGAGKRAGQLRNGLVVAEVALSCVLLITGGLLLKSFGSLASTDLGFRREGLVTARVALPEASYPEPARRLAFFEELVARIEATPGVTAVGLAQGAPMSGWNVQGPMVVEGSPPRDPADQLIVHYQQVSPGYFEALGVPVVAGRGLRASDRDSLAPVAVINEVLARQEFGDRDPIGRRIRRGLSHVPDPNPRWFTVVGVVGAFRHYRLPTPMGPALYLPAAPDPPGQLELAIRAAGSDPGTVIPAVRAALRELDPTVPLYRVARFEDTLRRVLWQQRLQGQIAGTMAVLALLLATIGVYGVISYGVRQRTRELGVRAAVGASAGALARQVVGEGGRLALAGIGLGLLAAGLFARLLSAMLHGVRPGDPVVFGAVAVVLAVVAVLASWLPARRASRVDPLVAIRE